jgi:hypothetical protein
MGVFEYLGKLLTGQRAGRFDYVPDSDDAHPLDECLLLCGEHEVPAVKMGAFRISLFDDPNPCIGKGCAYRDASPDEVLDATGWSEEHLIEEVYHLLLDTSGTQLPPLGRRLYAYGRDHFGWRDNPAPRQAS